MNYFQPTTKYYIVDVLSKENKDFYVGGIALSKYVKETFPVLYELELEKQRLINLGIKKSSKDYSEHMHLIHFALEYLDLPRYLLARGDNDNFAIEPVTGNKIESIDKEVYSLEDIRISDVNLEHYYVSNYEEKVNNFFNPTIEIKQKTKLRIEELAMIKVKQEIYNRKNVRLLRKGMNNNDN